MFNHNRTMDVHKTVVTEDFSLWFRAVEVYSKLDDDYEYEDVELVNVEILGVEYKEDELPPKMVDSFLEWFADDSSADWEYF